MQIDRLFGIIYTLLDRKTVTAGELALRFEVSARTIYRDVERLSSAGIPIYMSKGKNGGISLLPDFILNKTVLTEEEKSNIVSSLKALSFFNLNESDTALNKLNSLFGNDNEDWIEVDFTSWGDGQTEKQMWNLLKGTILKKQAVSFLYSSGKGESTDRNVYPLKLYFKGRSWYLYGFCTKREDYRFFKLRRIKNLEVTSESFNKSAPKCVLLDEDEIFKEKLVSVKLKISEEMAYRVFDEFEIYKKLSDGSFEAEIDFPLTDWLYTYVFSFGDKCEVLEPNFVREEIKNKLQNSLNKYL